jgi:hypothetical protein
MAGVILAALALAQAAPPPAASGVFFTGNDLYEECQKLIHNACTGYVMAVSDALQDAADANGSPRTVCLSPGVEARQLVDVVVRYLREHPEIRHASAASMVTVALQGSFPCPPAQAR